MNFSALCAPETTSGDTILLQFFPEVAQNFPGSENSPSIPCLWPPCMCYMSQRLTVFINSSGVTMSSVLGEALSHYISFVNGRIAQQLVNTEKESRAKQSCRSMLYFHEFMN